MTRFLGILWLCLVLAYSAAAQDTVCIPQADAQKCVTAANELKEARIVIQEFQKERAASIAEREKAAVVIAGLNELVVVKDRVIAGYEQINALYKQVIELQAEIIQKQAERLMKGKSPWSKFLDAVKVVLTLAAGITLGRGL